jgi:hypothetical protein
MSYTGTQTQAFTLTTARYVTSKIAADLDLVRSHYQRPPEVDVTRYAEEAAQLLAKRYLGTVEYGFKKNGTVVFALKYETRADGLLADDRPGKVPANLDLRGTTFYSWLTYSDTWDGLDAAGRATFKSTLPVQRTSGESPAMGNGYWESGKSYASNGEGVERKVFQSL